MKEKNFKPIWITYWIQLIPAAFSFIVLSVFSFNMMLTDVFNVPYSAPIWNFYDAIYKSLFIVDDFYITVGMYICILLCVIGAVVIAVIGKNILSKKDRALLFIPLILAVLTALATLTESASWFDYTNELVACLLFICCIIIAFVQIYFPIHLAKLQKS